MSSMSVSLRRQVPQGRALPIRPASSTARWRTALAPAVLGALLVPLVSLAQAPAWHELPAPTPIHDLDLSVEGEGFAISWDGTDLDVHELSFPEGGVPVLGPSMHTHPSNSEPRLSLAGSLALIANNDGVSRWDGSQWTVHQPNPTSPRIVDVRIDRLDPASAVALPDFVSSTAHAYFSYDGGATWGEADLGIGTETLASAALHGGSVTVFPLNWDQPLASTDRISWTTLPPWVQVLDTTVLESGDLVGTGMFGDYVIGPVGADLAYDQLDTTTHYIRVAGEGQVVWLLGEGEGGIFDVFELPDPFSLDSLVALPSPSLESGFALGAWPGGRLVVTGMRAGAPVLLWRNRPPALHPGCGEPAIEEGGSLEVRAAIDPDGDEPSLISGTCVLNAATAREVLLTEQASAVENELHLQVSMEGSDPLDCPGAAGWPFECSLEVTDGEQSAPLSFSGSVASPAPTIAGLAPAFQEVQAAGEAEIVVEGVSACRLGSVTARVWQGADLLLTEPVPAGGTYRFEPHLLTVPPAELTVEVTAVDEDLRQAEAQAQVSLTKGSLTVLAPDLSIVYGDEAPVTEPIYDGFGPGEDESSLDAAAVCETSYSAGDPAGTYPVTCSGAVSDLYDLEYVDGTLTVEPARLRIVALDQTKQEGESLVFEGTEYEVEGLRPTDEITGVTLHSDGAGAEAEPGDYEILPSDAEIDPPDRAGSYDIEYLAGTLTVSALPLPEVSLYLHLEAPGLAQARPGELVWVGGRVEPQASSVLTEVSVDLEGALTVVPGSLTVYEDCGSADPHEQEPPAGSTSAAAGGGLLWFDEVSECRRISFLARVGLGRPRLGVEACSYRTSEGEIASIEDCSGGIEPRGRSLPGCSCRVGQGKGAGLLPLILLVLACFVSRPRRHSEPPRAPWARRG
ncbi:MAG: MBG domain-containing protein [Myxococcota bacterium]